MLETYMYDLQTYDSVSGLMIIFQRWSSCAVNEGFFFLFLYPGIVTLLQSLWLTHRYTYVLKLVFPYYETMQSLPLQLSFTHINPNHIYRSHAQTEVTHGRTGVNTTTARHNSYSASFILAPLNRLQIHVITANVTGAQLKIHKHNEWGV